MLEDPQEEQESELTIMPPLFWVAIIFLAFGVLSGCATVEQVPVCAKYGYTPVELNGEPGVFLDAEDIENLHSLVMGLAQGKCVLPSAGQGLGV